MQKSVKTGQWDAESLRGTNADDPVNLQDWVTLGFLQDYVAGGRSGVAGVYRVQGTGNGIATDVTLIPVNEGTISDKEMVIVMFDGINVSVDDYEVSTDGRGVTFDDPIPNGVYYDIWVVTSALTTFTDGAIDPSKLSLTQDYIITGDASNFGTAVTRSSIRLDEWGVPTSTVLMNGQRVTNVATPTGVSDATRKDYVDGLHTSKAPFDTIGSRTAYTLGNPITNPSSKTMLITLEWQRSSGNYSTKKNLYIETAADSGFTTDLVTRHVTIQETAETDSRFVTIFVPGDYFCRMRSPDSIPAHSFYYQIAQTPA